MTEKQAFALNIIKENPGICAASFAEKMWPDSNMHTKHSNGGDGCQVGKAGWLCGGSYLGKLKKIGLVRSGGRLGERGFFITNLGSDQLRTVSDKG